MRRIVLSMLILVVLASNSWARVWHVKPGCAGSPATIQAGIDSAGAGDTVLVAPGTYRGEGNRDIDFKGKAILVISQRRFCNTTTDSSVIDCEGTYEEPHRGFYFHSGETASAVLDGFVITNGHVQGEFGTAASAGGGILCDSLSSPMIRHNTISNCWALWGGSGIYCESSSPTIRCNTICNSGGGCLEADVARAPGVAQSDFGSYYGGGGIGCHQSSAVIRDNMIFNNEASCGRGLPGGGIGCIFCQSITIADNEIHDNESRGGGGIYLKWSTADITGNNIIRNGAVDGSGGAIYAEKSELTISGNKLDDNAGYFGGTGAVSCDSCTVSLIGNEICNNHKGAMSFEASAVDMESNDIHDNSIGACITLSASLGSHIKDNTIRLNSCEGSGAVLSYGGDPATIIEGNTFKDNSFSSPGSSTILCSASSPHIAGNLIVRNGSGGWSGAGGIRCEGASPLIENNTIAGNTGGKGAGVFIDALSSPTLTGNIIANDSISAGARSEGGGIYSESATVSLFCNDVYNNQGGDYLGIPDQTGLNGNISVDPLFCSAAADDFAIMGDSPCLAGNHPGGGNCGIMGALGMGCPVATLLRDFRAELAGPSILVRWKLSDASNRMDFFVLKAEAKGAEFTGVVDPAIERDGLSFTFKDTDCKPGTAYRYRVGVSDESGRRVLFETGAIATPAAKLALYQNYPNPFNPSTSISYYLPSKARVAVEIYAASGALLKHLMNAEQESGAHAIAWNGQDDRGAQVSSGVYFCRLKAGKEAISRKMILLR